MPSIISPVWAYVALAVAVTGFLLHMLGWDQREPRWTDTAGIWMMAGGFAGAIVVAVVVYASPIVQGLTQQFRERVAAMGPASMPTD
jgi:hypothetical protein